MLFSAFFSKENGVFGASDVDVERYRLSFYFREYRVTVSDARMTRWKAAFDRRCSLANNYGCSEDTAK